jgi:hypothetical protein
MLVSRMTYRADGPQHEGNGCVQALQGGGWFGDYINIASKENFQRHNISEPFVPNHSRFEEDEDLKRSRRKTTDCTICQNPKPLGYDITPRTVEMPSNEAIQSDERQPSKYPPENLTRVFLNIFDEPESGPASPVRQKLPDSKHHVAFQIESSVGEDVHSSSGHPTDSMPRRPPPPPPPLQHWEMGPNAGETDGSQVHPDFTAEWDYIRKLRIEILSLRSQIHLLRGTLREKQNTKSRVDDQLFQRVRMKELGVISPNSPEGKESKTILDLIDDHQKAVDDYGPLEDDCNRLEDLLYGQEFELHRLEGNFYKRWMVIPDPDLGQSEVPAFQLRSSQNDEFLDDEEDLRYHPLVKSFLSKIGNLDLLQERLEDIIDERESLEDQRETRNRVGLSLGEEEQTWLDGSQRLQDELVEEIRLLQMEVDKLKQECLTKNLVDEDGEPTDFQFQEKDIFEEEDEIISSQISEYSKHSILLPQPSSTMQSDIDESNPKPSEETSFTVPGRINTWILQRLRISPLDVGLLARTYEGKGGETSEGWQRAVLDFWYEDGTITSAIGFQVYTSSMTTQAPRRSKYSSNSSDISDSKHHFRLFISSSLRPPSDQYDGREVAGAVSSSPASPRGRFAWNSQ